METMRLRDEQIVPTPEVLEQVLGECYPTFAELMSTATNTYQLTPEWNYYKDGKAWLCKVIFKKKTVFWLSVWEGFVKTSFYFTERNMEGVALLDIEESIKDSFTASKPIGKLIPLILSIDCPAQLADFFKIVEYKKGLK